MSKQSFDYDIESIEWIDNGRQIMLWTKMYECDENGVPQDRNEWNNKCQIQVSID